MNPRQRDPFVDEIRGLALLGIVLVNVPFFALSSTGYTMASLATFWDRLAAFLTIAFAQAKFYLLFSFLFGYSLSYLLRNDTIGDTASRDATAKDAAVDDIATGERAAARRRRFKRRLWVLGAIGALHAVFAFIGDILLLYALLGVSMLWLVRWRDRSLLRFGVVVGVAWLLLLWGLGLSLEHFVSQEGAYADASFDARFDLALATGGFVEASQARWRAWPEAFGFMALLNGPAVWAMFAFGAVAGRRHLLAQPERHLRFWRRSALIGWGLGLPLALGSAYLAVGGPGAPLQSVPAMQGVLIGFAGAAPLSLAYVASLALIRIQRPRAWAWAAAPGRMSLSGYIGESLLLSWIFCGYGAGLFGHIGAAAAAAIALAVWLALDVFARLWLSRFAQGPLEAAMRWIIR